MSLLFIIVAEGTWYVVTYNVLSKYLMCIFMLYALSFWSTGVFHIELGFLRYTCTCRWGTQCQWQLGWGKFELHVGQQSWGCTCSLWSIIICMHLLIKVEMQAKLKQCACSQCQSLSMLNHVYATYKSLQDSDHLFLILDPSICYWSVSSCRSVPYQC